MKYLASILITTMTIFSGCGSNSTPSITVEELNNKFEAGEEFYLLDVRTTPEYIDSHLEFADDLIAYDELDKFLDKLPQDKSDPIYLFCRTGRRSGTATEYLRSIGYENSFNVTGGIYAWQDAGFKTISGE